MSNTVSDYPAPFEGNAETGQTVQLGAGPFPVTRDEFELVKLMLEEAGAVTDWAKAVTILKDDLIPEYGAAKATALVIHARRACQADNEAPPEPT